MLFKYDVHDGPEGRIDYITPLCAPQYWNAENFSQVPFATLAFTLSALVLRTAPTTNRAPTPVRFLLPW